MACPLCRANSFGETVSDFPRQLSEDHLEDVYGQQATPSVNSASFEFERVGHQLPTDPLRPTITSVHRLPTTELTHAPILSAHPANSNPRRLERWGHSHSKRSLYSQPPPRPQHTEAPKSDSKLSFPVDMLSPATSVDLNTDSSAFGPPLDASEICPAHKRRFEAYCFRDDQFLCLKCLIENKHHAHRVSDLESAFSSVRTELAAKFTFLRSQDRLNCAALNQTAEETLDVVTGNFNYATKKVDLFFAEIANFLNERKTEIIADLMWGNQEGSRRLSGRAGGGQRAAGLSALQS